MPIGQAHPQKIMKDKYAIGTKTIWEEEAERELHYFLTEQSTASGIGYGIMVLKDNGEQAHTGSLSTDQEIVLSLMQKLMQCTITPCVLNEVVDDWLETFTSQEESIVHFEGKIS